MPWIRRGTTIYKQMPDGSLKKKQTCGSVAKANAALRLLRMAEGCEC